MLIFGRRIVRENVGLSVQWDYHSSIGLNASGWFLRRSLGGDNQPAILTNLSLSSFQRLDHCRRQLQAHIVDSRLTIGIAHFMLLPVLGVGTVSLAVSDEDQPLPRRASRGSGTPASANPLARRMQLSHDPHGVSRPS